MISIDKKAEKAINMLTSCGFDAYLVGGYVRDIIMKKTPKDIDITTNALPNQVENVFSNYHFIETGIKHGTVTVIIENTPIEITTYRIDCGYSDGRHPDKIEFSKNINEDLSRRDFTINSVAYNPKIGFIDVFGGIDDINKSVIRCVGKPQERFVEDSLRILRAIRFSSVLGFEIDGETKEAMFDNKSLLKKISKERIFVELSKTLCGKNIENILNEYVDILSVILPELSQLKGFEQHNFHHIYDVLAHTAKVTQSIEALPHLRYAALFHDCAKPECFSLDENGVGHFYSHAHFSAAKAQQALTRLHCDTKTKEQVIQLVKLHDTPIENSETVIKKRLNRLGAEAFFDLIKLQRADNLGMSPEFFFRQKYYDEIEETAKEIIQKEECFSLKNLVLNGNDLISLGYEGKEIGEKLEFLLNAVIENMVENEKGELIAFLIHSQKEIRKPSNSD